MLVPRDYQEAACDSVFSYYEAGNTGNPIIAMPTGTGKSLVIALFVWRVLNAWPRQRIVVLTHVKELIEQNFQKLLDLWPTAPAGVYSASVGRKDHGLPVLFAGIDSVVRRPDLFGHVDLVLIDECQLVSPAAEGRYAKFLTGLREVNEHVKVIGLSATPYRLGLGALTDGGLFTDVCYDMTTRTAFAWLVRQGYLAPLVTKRTHTQIDTSGVALRGGEFVESQLQAAADQQSITYGALHEVCHYGQQRGHWLLFATGIEHCHHIADMLEEFGVPATVVHSKLGKGAREAAIAGFRAGHYRALVNNNVLTTGFDFPGIDLIGVLRPTSSPVLWVQMLGRGTRPAERKENCLVLDFAGNTPRLGPIDDPVLPRAKGSGTGGTAPVRLCEHCGTYSHASALVCESCGADFPRNTKLTLTAGTAEVMSLPDAPQVDTFGVDRVTYSVHCKPGRPDSLRVTYFCGLRMFSDWVCLEHAGNAYNRALRWWGERSDALMPTTCEQAMEVVEQLRTPTSIHVWTNRKYPEVTGYGYD